MVVSDQLLKKFAANFADLNIDGLRYMHALKISDRSWC